jgi:23S rRNA G2069 N7-methylase RlmK/C1962 C5-methylase RlmI
MTEDTAEMRGDVRTEAQAEMLFNRLSKRRRHLGKWAERTGAGAYRLYDRDIPEIPLLLDLYRNDRINAVSGALYKRPYEKDSSEEERWLNAMTAAAAGALDINESNIFIKIRRRQRHRLTGDEKKFEAQYQKENTRAFEMTVKENRLSFIVNLSDYIDTGIFPDLRLLRKMVASESYGKTVLDLFCYTGAFSVYAAAGGALSVDSVDMSSTYLKRAERNAALNGAAIRPERTDVFRFLERAESGGKRWDIIIAGPPSFSNSKKMKGNTLGGVFDVKRDYRFLVSKCAALLKDGGELFFSVNARSFNLLKNNGTAGITENIYVKDITERVRDEDFRGKRMPVCYLIQKREAPAGPPLTGK